MVQPRQKACLLLTTTRRPHAGDYQEYLATCVNEAVAIADKLMSLSIIESTSDMDQERFKPSNSNFYVLRVSFFIVLVWAEPPVESVSPSTARNDYCHRQPSWGSQSEPKRATY